MTLRRFNRSARSLVFPAGLLVVAWYVLLGSATGVSQETVSPVLDSFTPLGFVALGVAVTMIAGELDLSAASVVAVSSIVAVEFQGLGLVGAIALTTLGGAALGGLQGYLIARLNVNSIVFTLGTLILLRGVAYLFGNQGVLVANPAMGDGLLTRYWLLTPSTIIALSTFAVVGMFLTYGRGGREIHAVGSDRAEALAAGVRLPSTIARAFAISGGCAALAGAIAGYQNGGAAPNSFDELLLSSVSAALIGGIPLKGGRGNVLHVALGVAILGSVSAGLAARGQDISVSQLVTGGLLVVVIAGEWLAGVLRRSRKAVITEAR